MQGPQYGGLSKISALDALRVYALNDDDDGIQFKTAFKKANFDDASYILKLAEQQALKIHHNYPNLSLDEVTALCVFAYKDMFNDDADETPRKTPFEVINTTLFLRNTPQLMKHGKYILFLLGAIRQLPRINTSVVKPLYVISESWYANVRPEQNWKGNCMTWPSFTCAYTREEAKILIHKLKDPVLFKVTGAFCAYDLSPFSNDPSTEFIILEPETRYLVTDVNDHNKVFNTKVVSVAVQFNELVLDNLIQCIRKPPPPPPPPPPPTDPQLNYYLSPQDETQPFTALEPFPTMQQPQPFLVTYNVSSMPFGASEDGGAFGGRQHECYLPTLPEYYQPPPQPQALQQPPFVTVHQPRTMKNQVQNVQFRPTQKIALPPPPFEITHKQSTPQLTTKISPIGKNSRTVQGRKNFEPPPPPPEFLSPKK